MTKQKSKGRNQALTYTDVLDVITNIVEEKEGEKVGPLSNSLIQAYLKKDKDIDVTDQTIRNKGMRSDSIFEVAFSDTFTFVNYGDSRMRGMIVNKPNFMEKKNEIRKEVES
jgi:hypothetical protein